MSENLNFGDLLRKKRAENNWTLRDLSEKSGISPAYISMLERGIKTYPSVRVLKKLAKIINLSEEQVLKIMGYINNDKKQDESLFFFDLHGLSEEDIELIQKQIEFLRERAKKKQQKDN